MRQLLLDWEAVVNDILLAASLGAALQIGVDLHYMQAAMQSYAAVLFQHQFSHAHALIAQAVIRLLGHGGEHAQEVQHVFGNAWASKSVTSWIASISQEVNRGLLQQSSLNLVSLSQGPTVAVPLPLARLHRPRTLAIETGHEETALGSPRRLTAKSGPASPFSIKRDEATQQAPSVSHALSEPYTLLGSSSYMHAPSNPSVKSKLMLSSTTSMQSPSPTIKAMHPTSIGSMQPAVAGHPSRAAKMQILSSAPSATQMALLAGLGSSLPHQYSLAQHAATPSRTTLTAVHANSRLGHGFGAGNKHV